MSRASILLLIALLVGVGSPVLAADSLTGDWAAVLKRPDKERDYHFVLKQDGDKLSGSMNSPRSGGAYRISSGSIDGRKIHIKIDREYKDAEVTFDIQAELADSGVIEGKVTVSGEDFASIRMERLPDPVGTWNMIAEHSDGGEHRAVLILRRTDEGLGGTMKLESREVEVRRVGFRAGRLFIAITVPTDEGELPIVVMARFDGKDTLKGEWAVAREDAEERISGAWRASRVAAARDILGDWATEAETENGSMRGRLSISKKDGKYVGIYQDESGEPRENVKHKSIELSDGGVTLSLAIRFEENELDFVVRLAFEDDNTLAGKWQMKDAADRSGGYKATRLGVKKAPEEKKRKVETL